MYNVNTEALSWNHCFRGKAISNTHSDCAFVALGIEHATQMCDNIFCGLFVEDCFSHIITQRERFSGKQLLNMKCVLVFCTVSVCNVCVCVCGFCNVCVCVCVGFVMCGCVYVWVL